MKYFLTALLVFIASSSHAFDPGFTSAKQAIVLDYQTGEILYAKNHEQRMATSSMSKVMTMIMVFEAIERGQISLEDEIKISERAWRKPGSKMFIEVGKDVQVEDLIRGVIIQSGNDATIALAEALAETEENFARKMTDRAHAIGMKDSQFKNASGWPDEEHYSTAHDLAIMAKYLLRKFPQHYKYYSETEFTFNNIKQRNRNPLLYADIGADGIKTGYTEDGGYGLIGSGMRDGRRVVMVLNGMESAKERASESKKIMDWALGEFEIIDLVREGENVDHAAVLYGKEEFVPVESSKELRTAIHQRDKENIKVSVQLDGPVEAPVQKGERVGTLIVEIPDRDLQEIPLITTTSIERLGFFQAAYKRAVYAIRDLLLDITAS